MFTVTARQVITELRASGSSDPHVLKATKEALLRTQRACQWLGVLFAVIGVVLTLTIYGAFVGIPLIASMVWVLMRARRNAALIEAAYAEYVSAVDVQDRYASTGGS